MGVFLAAVIICLGVAGGFWGWFILGNYILDNNARTEKEDERRDWCYLAATALAYYFHKKNKEKEAERKARKSDGFLDELVHPEKYDFWGNKKEVKKGSLVDQVIHPDEYDFWGNKKEEKKGSFIDQLLNPDDYDFWGNKKKKGGWF